MAVGDDVHAEHHGRSDESQAEDAQRLARALLAALLALLVVVRLLFLVLLAALLAQQHHKAKGGGEQDDLLAEGVEAAVVEGRGRDDVGGLALGHGHLRQQVSVDAAIVAEAGQAGEAPYEQGRDAGERRREEPHPNAPAHSRSRSRLRTFAIVSSSISGTPTEPTAICERPTSGAWNAKNRIPSAKP